MATSPDHPELQFVQARYFSKGRPDGPPLWIVIHDMEATETATRAESTAAYFATMPDGRTVSSHYCVDSDSVVQCVRLGDVAWTVGNRPGNYRGINWEMSGFARQTREQWLDDFGRAMFAEMVPIIRADAAKYGIPLRRCTIADLKAYRPGITSHNDLRLAFGGTTHTDPGPAFPWDYFMDLLTGGDDMPSEWHTGEPNGPLLTQGNSPYAGSQRDTALGFTWEHAEKAHKGVDATLTRLSGLEAKVDQILAILQAGVPVPSEVTVSDASVAEIAEKVADVQHARSAE